MTDILKNPSVKSAKKKYDSEVNALYKKEASLDKERRKAKCDSCSINSSYLNFPLEKRYTKCDCKNNKSVVLAYNEYVKTFNSIEKYKKEYAKEIFEILKNEKPRLYSRPDKKTVEWDEEFPESFEKLPTLLYSAIIALAEGTPGRYLIK